MEINEITQKIIGCAYTVHNTLGTGFLEKVYENALSLELQKAGFKVSQQKPVNVYYDGVVVGEYFIDLFVEDQVVVELKVGQHIADIHVAQVVNYLKATQMQIGLVINFGKSVEVRRAINSPREPSRS